MEQPNILQKAFNNPLFSTLFLAIFWGLGVSGASNDRIDTMTIVFHVIISLSFGAIMTLLMRRQLQRFDKTIGITSLSQRVTLQHSLKSVTVPTDQLTRDLLPGYLDYLEARQAKQRRSNRIIVPFLLVIYGFNAVVQHSLWWLLAGTAFVAVIAWAMIAAKRNQQNIPKLRVKLTKV